MHEMENNYIKMVEQAGRLFLGHDQEKMIRMWGLDFDEQYLYVDFMGEKYRIDRAGAQVEPVPGTAHILTEQVCVMPAMILYDLLTYAKERPVSAGRFSSVSELGGIIGAGHANTLQPSQEELYFTGKAEALSHALAQLGGTPFGKGDASAIVPVFADFSIVMQFWDADDEFPASIRYLFDANALRFMHYETLWYVMSELIRRIQAVFALQ